MMKREVLYTVEDAWEFFKDFGDTFSFDTETTSLSYTELEIVGCSFCNDEKACYIPIRDYNRNEWVEFLSMLFNNEGEGEGLRIICHNITYDMMVLDKYSIKPLLAKWYDTMVAYHLLDENLPSKGLKYLTKKILHREVTEFNEVSNDYYNESFYQYGIDDAVNTWDLYNQSLPQLTSKNLERLFFKIEMPFQRVILEMKITGVVVDQDKMLEVTEKLSQDSMRLEGELLDMIGENYEKIKNIYGEVVGIASAINLGSSNQLGKILFGTLGLQPVEFTKTGSPSTGKFTLNHYKSNEFVGKLIKYKGALKLLSGFMKPMPSMIESDGRVRPSFLDTGTKTGRLSSSKPNLQQLPSPGKADYDEVNVRECYVVPEGYCMITADYSGQEICVMAQQSKDPTLVKSLRNGYDMHLAIANQFYNLGIPEECLSKKHPDYKAYKEKFYNERSRAKTITFGLAYGKSSYGFSKDFGISEEEAQKIVDDYFAGMPGLKKAIEEAHHSIDKHGYVRSMAGRYRHFTKVERYGKEVYDGKAYRQSFNFLIQGFSADMIRAAAVNVWVRKRKHPEWVLKQIMTVHDELVYEVKEEYVDEAMSMIKEAMELGVGKYVVPLMADVQKGKNYGEAK